MADHEDEAAFGGLLEVVCYFIGQVGFLFLWGCFLNVLFGGIYECLGCCGWLLLFLRESRVRGRGLWRSGLGGCL